MRLVLYLSILLTLPVGSVLAQQAPASKPLACDGNIAIVRVSKIKAGGTVEGFMNAVDAHRAWYRNNGIKDDEIYAARVIVRDEHTGVESYSDTEVLTFHINPPAADRIPRRGDDAWNAYVKMYRDNSDLESEYMTCMPKNASK